ncbi:MAG: PEP-CTERM sorting domain-containing protein [Phycisphaerales bacterium]|nr:PEP-CTERM sorting domain-containing protein [Phycisphaerales bacterium]
MDYVEDGLPFSDDLAPGMLFTGRYSYDSGVADNAPENGSVGGYSFPNRAMSVTVGPMDFATEDLAIGITNHSVLDNYSAGNESDFVANGLLWHVMAITLRDTTATAFSSDALPVGPPNLDDFEFARIFFLLQPNRLSPSVTGQLTSIRLVPEPGTLSLLVAGLFLCAHRRTL